MVCRIITVRYFAIALLAIAHMGAVLHAAEFGVGHHEHEGVPCLYGATNDDDHDLLPPTNRVVVTVIEVETESAVCIDIIDSTPDLRLPPATGPPVDPS